MERVRTGFCSSRPGHSVGSLARIIQELTNSEPPRGVKSLSERNLTNNTEMRKGMRKGECEKGMRKGVRNLFLTDNRKSVMTFRYGTTKTRSQRWIIYHVLNRTNARRAIFEKDEDYVAFETVLTEAVDRSGIRLLSYCVMTNHFHLLLWPHEDGDLRRWMQWLMTSHVRHYHRHDQGSGHVCERQGASRRYFRDEPAASALPLTTYFQSLIYPAKRFRCSPMSTL